MYFIILLLIIFSSKFSKPKTINSTFLPTPMSTDQQQSKSKDKEFSQNPLTNTFINNTLTNTLQPLPQHVNIYACGPTVYDQSHLGHARTYILYDTIIRTLKYLGHSVTFSMNITDVDDKIITKTEQFLTEFVKSNLKYMKPFNELFSNDKMSKEELFEIYIFGKDQNGKKLDIKSLSLEQNTQDIAHKMSNSDIEQMRSNFIANAFHDCQSYVTTKYTNSFFSDMKTLNIFKPNHITKVTEYIEVIVEFIEELIANGAAYKSNGSVYFDMGKYLKEGNKRWYSTGAEEEEETEISQDARENTNKFKHEKKDRRDFALWKKFDHPLSYDTPLGRGRPGWHIECSAMAGDIFFGNRERNQKISKSENSQENEEKKVEPASIFSLNSLHLHGGGIDLAFPHHENEILQSISLDYSSSSKRPRSENVFANYFSHTGHLHIEGLKMSKSLKNFITIADCLSHTNFKVLRLMFLMTHYENTAVYKTDVLENAQRIWSKISNFISTGEAEVKRRYQIKSNRLNENIPSSELPTDREQNKEQQTDTQNFLESSSSPGSINNTSVDVHFVKSERMNGSLEISDRTVISALNTSRMEVHNSLKNNFDFNKSITIILNFITLLNQKMYEVNGQVLENSVNWVKEIISVFGLVRDADESYDSVLENNLEKKESGDESIAMVLKEFREQIRNNLKSKDIKGLYGACDSVRDKLREYGWIIEDKGNESVLRKCNK